VIEILDPGPLTTVQDLGRPGLAHLGVPPSGAADTLALEVGNRLVGNRRDAAALEATLIGPRLRFERAATIALTGACEPRRITVAAGEELRVGPCFSGARVYVCVRGGIDVPEVLGSCSTDLLTGIGPAPLRAGDRVAIGPEPAGDLEDVSTRLLHDGPLRVVPGPRDDWFADGALDTLCRGAWSVSTRANRIGVWLDGPALERARTDELESEGLVTGALQVPSGGKPILLLNDHPTTGGYPVIAVVHSNDLPRAGQLRTGDTVSFRLYP